MIFFLTLGLFLLWNNAFLQEHLDYEIVQSLNPEFNKAVVRVNVFKEHRQTIQVTGPFSTLAFLLLLPDRCFYRCCSCFDFKRAHFMWCLIVLIDFALRKIFFPKIPSLFLYITCRLQSSRGHCLWVSWTKSEGRWRKQWRKSICF